MMHNPKIRWAAPLRPQWLQRLYETDAEGLRDMELCDKVGTALFARCQTFVLVSRGQVVCPLCHTDFKVLASGTSACPYPACDWSTTHASYIQSIRNYNAYPGRAIDAYLQFYERYPQARTYAQKITLIDQLIHSFHINEQNGLAVKSVASKLLEGNKKAVVRFLDNLSAINSDRKATWRQKMGETIDAQIIRE
jgi:hypothetical protein